MNEIVYFPKSTNSRLSYLKVYSFVVIITLLFMFFSYEKHHDASRSTIYLIFGFMAMIYISFESITTKVIFNFEKKQLEVFYLTLYRNYKLEIPFDKLSIEFKKRRRSLSSYDIASHIYEDQKIKYKIKDGWLDNFSEATLQLISSQTFSK